MTRSYESNGPDVKIRGSAQQIAEKYATLGRDAQASGDRVMAENYLQHAEHYNRIIAAAQSQLQVQVQRDYRDEFDDEDEQEAAPSAAPEKASDGSGPQPVISGMPAEVALKEQITPPAAKDEAEAPAEPQAEQPKPRRARRPRKTAKDSSEDAAGEAPAASPDPQLAATES